MMVWSSEQINDLVICCMFTCKIQQFIVTMLEEANFLLLCQEFEALYGMWNLLYVHFPPFLSSH